jgi:hypothetical protein
VTSAEDGAPLPGVTVAVKGTSSRHHYRVDGSYQINVPQNTEYAGVQLCRHVTMEVPISEQNQIDVVIEPDLLEIDEVVVTAMGIRKEKKPWDTRSRR